MKFILDNYFTLQCIKLIKDTIRLQWFLDVKTEKGTCIKIYAKPKHYNTYTLIFTFTKKDSCYTFLKLVETNCKEIKKVIGYKDENNLWKKFAN